MNYFLNWISEHLRKSKVFWASALVEAGNDHVTRSCMPPNLEIPNHIL